MALLFYRTTLLFVTNKGFKYFEGRFYEEINKLIALKYCSTVNFRDCGKLFREIAYMKVCSSVAVDCW
jgi:hypothetical protein